MTAQPFSLGLVGWGAQMRDHRAPAAAIAAADADDVRIPWVVDPAPGAEDSLRRFADARNLGDLARRGYEVPRHVARRISEAPFYRKLEDALSDHEPPDGVLSVVPAANKRQVADLVFEAKAHLHSDKPTAASVDDAMAMVGAARELGLVLKGGYQLYQMAGPLARWIEERGLVVREWSIDWSRRKGLPDPEHFWNADRVGVVADLGKHLLGALQRLSGQTPARVVEATTSNAVGRQLKGDAFKGEDTFAATLELSGGATATVSSSWHRGTGPGEEITFNGVVGDGTVVEGRLVANKHRYYLPRLEAFVVTLRHDGEDGGFDVGPAPLAYTTAMIEQAAAFYAACRGAQTADPDLLSIERTGEAILDAAARRGVVVEIR